MALAKAQGNRFKNVAGAKYLVPSASGPDSYVVDAEAGECTCPDHEVRRVRCKHIWAVTYFRQEVTASDGTTVVTEAVQAVRVTYAQNWPAYNRAQTEEKDRIQVLLRGLCDGIVEPKQERGRPRVPLADAVYGMAMKVYGTMSGRRSASDLRDCETKGLVARAASYNTLFRYAENPALGPLLAELINESAKPLAAVEDSFAVDSTGFATSTYVRWFDHRYGQKSLKRWVKCHAMVGTRTNVVTAVRVTEESGADSPEFSGLVQETAANGFRTAEVSADKAYLSHANLAVVESVGGQAYIPFKSNSGKAGSAAWKRLWHLYELNSADFLAHYHKRSNVESTFSAIKRKFGAGVRAKTPAAQFNEVLLKCLCQNLTVLVHSIHELGIEPKFWQVQS